MDNTNQDPNQNPADQKQLGYAYNWLNDHGQVGYEKLKQLAEANTSESLERLHELADDNNIQYDQTTDPLQLAEEINSAMDADANTGVE
jgi:hypothetical protein